jgi:hypothetical protein
LVKATVTETAETLPPTMSPEDIAKGIAKAEDAQENLNGLDVRSCARA